MGKYLLYIVQMITVKYLNGSNSYWEVQLLNRSDDSRSTSIVQTMIGKYVNYLDERVPAVYECTSY